MGSETQLKIAELFYSIQGESSFAGYPCFFIRLANCNLRCTYCDTRYAYEDDHPLFSISKILEELKKHPAGRTVLLETNGSLSLTEVPQGVVKIMDMKCPGSGMHEKMDFNNFSFLTKKDEIKFVLGSRDDYNWAVQLASQYTLQNLTTVTFSPVKSKLDPAILAGWILEDHLPVRLRLQLHTIIWPGKTKGF